MSITATDLEYTASEMVDTLRAELAKVKAENIKLSERLAGAKHRGGYSEAARKAIEEVEERFADEEVDLASMTYCSMLYDKMKAAEAKLAAAQAQSANLRAALTEAVEMVVDWGAYADPYFKEKWGLEEDVAKLRHALAPTSAAVLE